MYSRYADDITFSTNKKHFPLGIARPISNGSHLWEVGDKLAEIISHTGFSINSKKTRMQYRTSRQDVTGLVVNAKVNVRSEYRRSVRAMAHRLFMTGSFMPIPLAHDPGGVIATTKKEGTLAQLHGMLGHIDAVDWHNMKLQLQSKGQTQESARSINSKENLYRRFLMFKEFYAALEPTIVCEGKTDNIYIRHAIRRLAAAYPSLATVSSDMTVSLNVRIFRYPQTSTGRILGLNDGGTGNIRKFIGEYVKEMERFKSPGEHHPVILLVDNDQGAKSVYEIAQQLAKKKLNGRDSFLRIAGNLYLISTPLREGRAESQIEDFFAEPTRNITLDGKSFNFGNASDPSKHGKHIFSAYVEKNADKIDFSGFAEILTRLAAVIDAHRTMHAEYE